VGHCEVEVVNGKLLVFSLKMNKAKIRIFRALDWLSNVCGWHVMAQNLYLWPSRGPFKGFSSKRPTHITRWAVSYPFFFMVMIYSRQDRFYLEKSFHV